MNLTEIAAFGGFILGVTNLVFLLYKEFWQKGKLNNELLKNEIMYIQEGLYYFQINVVISAKIKDLQLKKIEIVNSRPVFGDDMASEIRNQTLKYACALVDDSIIDNFTPKKILIDKVNSLYQNKILIQDLIIPKDNHHSLTFAGSLKTVRYSDGFQEMPLKEWNFKIHFSEGVKSIPFEFEVLGTRSGRFIN